MASLKSSFNHPTADSSQSHPTTNVNSGTLGSWPFPTSVDHQDVALRTYSYPPDSATVYPVVDTSTNSASSSGENVGRFIHTQCEQALFNAEYLRSNKASGHKNLRCFPHCCGGHNPKSFCGAGLVVECTSPQAQIALGRFEEVVKSPRVNSPDSANAKASTIQQTASTSQHDPGPAMSLDGHDLQTSAYETILPGHRYSRRELFRELKSPDNPFGMWFKGTAVASHTIDPSGCPRFHLNGNRASWHYGWQSSRLNCKNLHAFRIYFFQNVSSSMDGDVLLCIGSVSSPPFRISSSRKARKTFKSSPSLQSLVDSDDQISIPRSSPGATGGDDDRLSVDSFDGSVPTNPTTITTLPTLRSRISHDQAYGFGLPTTSGEMLPSLSSRLTRAATITMAPPPHLEPLATRQYRDQPDRKRLTRSSSLQTDYYTSPFVIDPSTREPRARTFPGDETKTSNVSGARSGRMSMDSLLNSPPRHSSPPPSMAYPFPTESDFNPSVSTISVPSLPVNRFHQQPVTPVSDMMQLHLGTPRTFPRSISASSDVPVLRPITPLNDTYRLSRKRTRSGDSGNNQLETHAWYDGPLMEEIAPDGEWGLEAQAHALGVIVAVVSRLRFTTGSSGTYQVWWKDATNQNINIEVISSETKPVLTKMCDVLVTVTSQLIHQGNFLADVRAKMREEVQRVQSADVGQQQHEGRCYRLLKVYEAMVALVLPRVEEQIELVAPVTQHGDSTPTPSPVLDLIRIIEHDLVTSRWWHDVTIFDDDDDEYPFMEFFRGYYEAILASTVHQPLSSSPTIIRADEHSLSGEWRLEQASFDELDTSRSSTALGWISASWLQVQIALYEVQTYHIQETATRLLLTISNSFVSGAIPFIADLDQQEPVVDVPVDHFPFALTRRHLVLAHRTWRESTTTIVLQTMQWPTETDSRLVHDNQTSRRELLRTRLTTSFSMLSSTRMQVRYVVEGSVTADAKLCAMAFVPPNNADMIEYFNAPGTWEILMQSTLTYERI